MSQEDVTDIFKYNIRPLIDDDYYYYVIVDDVGEIFAYGPWTGGIEAEERCNGFGEGADYFTDLTNYKVIGVIKNFIINNNITVKYPDKALEGSTKHPVERNN